MRKSLTKVNNWVVALLILFPPLLGASRDFVLNRLTSSFSVQKVPIETVSELSCTNGLCQKEFTFKIAKGDWFRLRRPTVGYYGVQLDSYIKIDGKSLDEIRDEKELRFTWSQFRAATFDQSQFPYFGYLTVVAVSPAGTKKLGMESPFIFLGERRSLEALQFVFSLFNIHIYLLCALVILIISGAVFASAQVGASIDLSNLLIQAFASAATLVAFATIFDGVLLAVKMPFVIVSSLAKLLWAPAMFINVLEKGRLRKIAILSWVLWISLGCIDWQYKDFLVYSTYRWAVLVAMTLSTLYLVQVSRSRFAVPFLILGWFDCMSLHGLLPVLSGVYLSPLGIAGLFIARYKGEIGSIIAHHRFWYQRRYLASQLESLRSSPSSTREDWLKLLTEVCRGIGKFSGASRVALCYMGFDSPLILSLRDGVVRRFEDGQLPPVFARVMQTRDPLWWVTEGELNTYLPVNSVSRADIYKSDLAVVLPILVGTEAYGALALTDFDQAEEIRNFDDKKHQIEAVINSFLDLVSVQLVKNKESSSSLIQKKSNDLIRSFSERSVFCRNREDVVKTFLQALVETVPASGMYFEFDVGNTRLQFVTSINLDKKEEAQWRDIPFRARPTNRISPFAISINERRSIYVEDIQTFFNFLSPQSVDVLKASGTRGFLSAPVVFGDNVLGLIAVMDHESEARLTSATPKLLDLPLKYLAYQLEQQRVSIAFAEQERALIRFADPRLAKLVASSSTSGELVVGDVMPCAIIVQDLRGSTAASRKESDAKQLAIKFAKVYQVAAELAAKYSASFEKGNGDGTITTLPTEKTSNGEALCLALLMLDKVESTAKAVLGVSGSLVCLHRGEPFRGVLGTARRIAWDTCGADINDTFSIEKSAKKIAGIVLAISDKVVRLESVVWQEALSSIATRRSFVEGVDGEVYFYNAEAVDSLREIVFAASRLVA